MIASGNTAVEQYISHGTIRSDPREKYFTPDEIAFNDAMIPLLEEHGMEDKAQRMCDCGNKYNAFRCKESAHADKKQMIFSYRCELRICPRCGKKHGYETRRKAGEVMKSIQKTRTHKFALLTLTERSTAKRALTSKRLKAFNQNVRKLINKLYPKKQNCGAMAVTEIGKRNNVHAHVLVYGPYISQEIISKYWKAITGDSYIVDVRAARDHKIALYYITKYILKAPEFDELEQYVLFLKALKGVRRLHTYGIMYGVKIPKREALKCPYCGGGIEYEGMVDELYYGLFMEYSNIPTQQKQKEAPLLTPL